MAAAARVRVAIVADTHMPKGVRRLPDACVEAIRYADQALHLGDVSAASVLEEIRSLNPSLTAVHGNVDSAELRSYLPETTTVEVGGARIGLVHDSGPAKGRLARMRRQFPNCEAVVFGHSHLPLHESENGFQIFNPGSPTERRRSPKPSFGIAEVADGVVRFEIVWIDRR